MLPRHLFYVNFPNHKWAQVHLDLPFENSLIRTRRIQSFPHIDTVTGKLLKLTIACKFLKIVIILTLHVLEFNHEIACPSYPRFHSDDEGNSIIVIDNQRQPPPGGAEGTSDPVAGYSGYAGGDISWTEPYTANTYL